jgi:hypothetical protein
MASAVTHTTECKECGTLLDPATPPGSPCPSCGCTARLHRASAADIILPSVEVAFQLRGKSAATYKGSSGARRHVREQYLSVGPSADGTRRRMHRTFDRDRDVYEEVVTEEVTGWLVRYLREPLTAHRGGGGPQRSARLPTPAHGQLIASTRATGREARRLSRLSRCLWCGPCCGSGRHLG